MRWSFPHFHFGNLTHVILGGEDERSGGVGADAGVRASPQSPHPPPPLHHVPTLARPLNTL